ncbi:hypothetical protein K438DRAFT_1790027 [Mycena galopus ATCC 62051]|nr:hypothetical protein K438DRAFT_1790027 [Mycena galopus ATCC 62051]
MAPPSEHNFPDSLAVTGRTNRSTKRKFDEYCEAESDPKPARKKPGPKPKSTVAAKLTAKSAAKPTKLKVCVYPLPVDKFHALETVDSDDDVEHVIKDKPVPAPLKILFMILEATTDSSYHVSLSSTVFFDDAIEAIHKTIGCVNVERKPMLTYKVLTANKNTITINLCTDNDRDGLVDDWLAKMKTKKDLSVNISVLPENGWSKGSAMDRSQE